MTGLNFDMTTIKDCIIKSTTNYNAIIDIDKMVKEIYELHEAAKEYSRNDKWEPAKSVCKLHSQTKELAHKHIMYDEEKMMPVIFAIVTNSFATSVHYYYEDDGKWFKEDSHRNVFFNEMLMLGYTIFGPSIEDKHHVANVIVNHFHRNCRKAA